MWMDHGLFINAFSTVGDILRKNDTRRVTCLMNMKEFLSKWPWAMSKLDCGFLIFLELLKKFKKKKQHDSEWTRELNHVHLEHKG
jgi:hypothetical protein